ncbi:MAG: hypothetical protein M1836_002874 [Candelina mexicana]|nr:MAG: hypothetical protein M1836_002874 [Candelina mexicana]
MPLINDSPPLSSASHSSTNLLKSAIMSNLPPPAIEGATNIQSQHDVSRDTLALPSKIIGGKLQSLDGSVRLDSTSMSMLPPTGNGLTKNGVGTALTDTPATTAPNSPKIPPLRQNSGSATSARSRPTTLDIPGLTKSKASPDGRIAQRDVGAKLVIVMVGLPARGKSYVTRKLARYLNWLQHNTEIFNVGERRRVAAGGQTPFQQASQTDYLTKGRPKDIVHKDSMSTTKPNGIIEQKEQLDPPTLAAKILINGEPESPSPKIESFHHRLGRNSTSANGHHPETVASFLANEANFAHLNMSTPDELPNPETMEQSADFFDPHNRKAAQLREQVAMSALDDLLDYVLDRGGSVGILDATNSTLERRKLIMRRIRERGGPELNVLFLESLCVDEHLLESNMRLKLSGPDYRDQDPTTALADFKKRVAIYERNYVPLGEYEEKNDMPYVQIIDVGRKVVSHQIRGFLSAQTVYYLLNFNLSPRQIWITRHGESIDNVNGKIGGDSHLSANGDKYARALTRFITYERKEWHVKQQSKALSTHFPPLPGDTTPPNPEYTLNTEDGVDSSGKNFCVWTSMLNRSIETAQYFDEDDYDIKQMKMLDELNAGVMEGMTYEEIKTKYADEYELRRRDKLHYRYPGPGGEGYLDIINRLRAVIVEVERMTDHVLLVGHRSVARVLLAYFKGLKREDVADVDVPLEILYMLEPKPYGVEFKAYRYNPDSDWFDHVPDYQLRRATSHAN